MISYQKLARYAKGAGVGLGIFERDYIISCALAAISKIAYVKDSFVFKGGTALRKVYFPDWRYSEDLDFSVLPRFDGVKLRSVIERWFEAIREEEDIEISLKDFHSSNGSARLRARFVGPLAYPNTVLLDITLDEPIVLQSQKRPILKTFPESPTSKINVYPLEEILAEKLRSILQRGKSRDYYDVWRLLKEKQHLLNLKLTADVFQKKCAHKEINLESAADFISSERVDEARRYWDEDLRSQLGHLPKFDIVVGEFNELLKALPLQR